MSDDRDYEGDAPQPWWRQRRILLIGFGIVALVAFIMTRGPQKKAPDQGLHQADIGQVVAYKAEAAPAAPPAPKAPTSFGAPPEPKPQPQAVTWPAMVTYAVPKREKPDVTKPKDDPQTAVNFKTSTIPGIKSGPALDLTYVLLPGLIFCELDVAIQSDIPGPLQCHLPGPVYSQTGTLLMEAGTHIYGNYQSMEQGGGARLRATSTFAITPNGVPVPLDGEPWADSLGRTGLPGGVDYHLMSRFGGAILLDLSQNALAIAQAKVSKGGNTYVSLNGSDQLANEILRTTVNQPPTFYANQGELIAVWLRSPIDFSGSYRIRKVSDP